MKTYYIYRMVTNEYLGSIEAVSVDMAELKWAGEHDMYSTEVYALSTKPGEPLA